jgi:hypothetical protein
MGQFRSPCPQCGQIYYWFLKAEDHACRECGRVMTEQETEEIWLRETDYHDEFRAWFQDLLLNHTKSCNIRDVLRGAYEKLEEEYIKMCREQDSRDKENKVCH